LKNFSSYCRYGWFVFFAIVLGGCIPLAPNKSFIAENGLLNLQTWNISTSGYIEIKGQWRFFWKQILSPTETSEITNYKLLYLPQEWDKAGFPKFGYGTYSIELQLPVVDQDLALNLPNVATAYNLYLNDTFFYSMGKVGNSNQNSVATYEAKLIKIPVSFLEKSNFKIRITLQISNYQHFRAGIYNPIYIGTHSMLLRRCTEIREFELFEMGILVFMLFYHIIFFLFLRRKAYHSSIFLTLMVFPIIIRTLILNTGSQYWLTIFPSSSYELMIWLQFFSTYSIPILGVALINSNFPKLINKKFSRVFYVVNIILIFSTFLPAYLYKPGIVLFILSFTVAYIYKLIILTKAIKKGISGGKILLLGFSIAFLCTVLELLHHFGILYLWYGNLGATGLLALLFSQSFLVAKNFSTILRSIEVLTETLENKVQERTEMLSKKTEELAQKSEIIEKNKGNLLASIRYAQRIQEAIMPHEKTLKKYFIESFMLYKPRDIVSGDFYFIGQKNDILYLAVVDCTGHGVPGAFMSILGETSLKHIVSSTHRTDPAEILEIFDREITNALNENQEDRNSYDGMVIGLCAINPKTQELLFAGAERPVYILRNSQLIELKGDKSIIGGSSNNEKTFTSEKFYLQKNDIIYLFSDGYSDQFGGANKKKYSIKRFQETLLNIAHFPLQEQKEYLEEHFEEWKGSFTQIDDVLIIAIKIE
jgi:serine phosphatase RsbU (regulator of sigma subunit)